jgi:hypothetical protein
MHTRMPTRTWGRVGVALAALGGLLLLGACGGDDGGTAAPTSTTAAKGLSVSSASAAKQSCRKEAGNAQSLGDSRPCDELAFACRARDFRACDYLFQVARLGSEYDKLATTCGNLSPEGDRYELLLREDPENPRGALDYCVKVLEPRLKLLAAATTTTAAAPTTETEPVTPTTTG